MVSIWRANTAYSTIGFSVLTFGNPNNLLAMFGNDGNSPLKSRLNLQLAVPYM